MNILKMKITYESNVFFDKKVVLTGSLVEFTRSEASKILEDLGAHVVSSVSKATDFVLCGSDPGSKFDKAKKLGIRIIRSLKRCGKPSFI